jgi:hypothetical protein
MPDRGRGGTAPYQRRYPAAQRGGGNRAMAIVVIVLVLAAVAATVWVMTNSGHKSGGGHAGAPPSRTKPSTTPAAATVLKPVGDSTFNIFATPPGNTEDPESAGNAIDNNPDTFWATSYYLQPNFGGLKPGTGLLIDMGREVRLSQVEVQFGTTGNTTAEIYLGNSNAMDAALSNFTMVAPAATASGDHTYTTSSSATGRYVLVWLKGNLPPQAGQPGHYQAQIYNVVIRGSTVPGAG